MLQYKRTKAARQHKKTVCLPLSEVQTAFYAAGFVFNYDNLLYHRDNYTACKSSSLFLIMITCYLSGIISSQYPSGSVIK